jgi:hypothetical protein
MGVLIHATTAEKASDWFGLQPGADRAIIAPGLAGAETAKLQVRMSDGSVVDTGDSCTATVPSMTITAANQSDSYRVLKSATVGSVLVDMV